MKDTDILDAALGLFAERGYGHTPVPRVALRAGVAVGTIYRYFPGKEGVVNALYRRWKRVFAETLLAGADLGGAPEDVFRQLWSRLAVFASDHPEAFAFLETHHHASYLDADSRALAEAIDAQMVAVIAGWQAAGAVRPGDPALLLAQVFGGFVGAFRHLRTRELPVPADLGARTVDAAWRTLSARSAASNRAQPTGSERKPERPLRRPRRAPAAASSPRPQPPAKRARRPDPRPARRKTR